MNHWGILNIPHLIYDVEYLKETQYGGCVLLGCFYIGFFGSLPPSTSHTRNLFH
jgi:hypothetical protein